MGTRRGEASRRSSQVSRRSAVLTATVATCCTAAGAAEPVRDTTTTVLPPVRVEAEVPESPYRVGQTTTATKTPTALHDVPQAITVVTRELIEDQDMRSMADVVRYVPGVTMGQGEGHRDAPTLRGNSSTADFFVDGVRDDVQYFRDLYNLERIEVLKGPNAMIFGRGGGGGVINRVTRRADGERRADIAVQAGSDENKRLSLDAADSFGERFAARLDAMYEDSDSYRDFVNLERYGINPTARIELSGDTSVHLGYEYFNDERTVDRGVPSLGGRPVRVGASTFFGNPEQSFSSATVQLANVTLEHEFSPGISLRNHTLFGDYDKFYQNVYPLSLSAEGNVTLDAYRSGTQRQNLFNQTDLTIQFTTGSIEHTVLAGVELGRQRTDNLRDNSDFRGTPAAIVPLSQPVTFAPVTFTIPFQDNDVDVAVAALYVQDQLALSPHVQIVAGVRVDQLEIQFDNHLNGAHLERDDDLVSPRAGVIYKPAEDVSLYASYSISYLPSSGDQFSSLDATSAALEPEEFENVELGAKWDLRPDLSLTAAVYQLDRTHTRAAGTVPGTIVLTGEQRSEGVELELSGALTQHWQVMAGYAYQDAEITRTTSAAGKGTELPLVPEQQLSLWNSWRFTPALGAGIGLVHQSEVFTSVSNRVRLPSFTRVDAAVYLALNDWLEARLNVENLLDETYWASAHNDNNITPGSPIAFRLSLTGRF